MSASSKFGEWGQLQTVHALMVYMYLHSSKAFAICPPQLCFRLFVFVCVYVDWLCVCVCVYDLYFLETVINLDN